MPCAASSALGGTAGMVAPDPCSLPDTLGTLHSWHIIRSSVQVNHCFFFCECSSYWSCSEQSDSTHMTTNIGQQTDIRGKKKTPGASSCAFLRGFPATSLLFAFCLQYSVSIIVEYSTQGPVIDSQWAEFSCRLIFNNVTPWRSNTKRGIAALDSVSPRVWK